MSLCTANQMEITKNFNVMTVYAGVSIHWTGQLQQVIYIILCVLVVVSIGRFSGLYDTKDQWRLLWHTLNKCVGGIQSELIVQMCRGNTVGVDSPYGRAEYFHSVFSQNYIDHSTICFCVLVITLISAMDFSLRV